jgi:ADP-ribosyl-[dinitrogen reductase] hydrolase
MIGAIAGDIIGSYWEFKEEKVKDRNEPLFRTESTITDDSILTIATASAILDGSYYSKHYKEYCKRYMNYGYGPSFVEWAHSSENYTVPNTSYGNGAAMRVSPIAWAFDSIQRVMIEAQQSACITHCHSEGIKGSQATAVAVYMARLGASKNDIKSVMTDWFDYDVDLDLDELHASYEFDISCQGTVPVAIACALQADDFEGVMRNGLYVGGDTDTLLAIAGSIAEPMYGVPMHIQEGVFSVMKNHPPVLLATIKEFEAKFGSKLATSKYGCDVFSKISKLLRIW